MSKHSRFTCPPHSAAALQLSGRHVRFLFQAFWTEHLWPSAGAYAALEQSGSSTPCAFLQDDATSRRERESCPDRICVQTGPSHNQLTGQAAPAISQSLSNPAAKGPNRSQLKCLHHCWKDQPGTDTGLAWRQKKRKPRVSALWWLKGTSVPATGRALLCTFVCVCARTPVPLCARVSWYSSSIWTAPTSTSGPSTQTVSARLGAAASAVVIWTTTSLW